MYESSDPATTQAIALLINWNINLQSRVDHLEEAQKHYRAADILTNGHKFHIYHLFNPTTGEDYVGATRHIVQRMRARFGREAKWKGENPCDWRLRIISHTTSLLDAEAAEVKAIADIEPSLNCSGATLGLASIRPSARTDLQRQDKSYREFPTGKILLVDAIVNINYKSVRILQFISKFIPENGDRISVNELRDHYHSACGSTWSEYIRKSNETDTPISRWFSVRNIRGVPSTSPHTPGYFIRGDQ